MLAYGKCIFYEDGTLMDIYRKTLLYDFYNALLSDHQRKIYEDAVFNDMSLSEIAESYGISRQGAHDVIKRTDRLLADYEAKLHVVERYIDLRDGLRKAEELIEDYKENKNKKTIEDIENIIKRLADYS